MFRLLINFVAFQIGWLACVIGGAQHMPWIGTGLALSIVTLHLWLAPRPRQELMLILTAGVIGAAWDSLLVTFGWLVYPSGTLIANTAPHWIVALWMVFATTLNVSLRWLRQRWLLAAGIGAIAGPLSYFIGYRLGGVDFPEFWTSMLVLGLGWAVLMPLLMALAERFDGMRVTAAHEAYA